MATTKDKGSILEQVVAWLHEAPDVIVERNVRLPMLGSRRATREIDVLLTTYAAGYPVRLAVECKNEEVRIGSPKIDSFRGKLEAVGLPPALGIYVSASGYTRGALEAARAAGIRPLVFDGLSADRLSLEVSKAFQSVVVLLPDVVRVWSDNDMSEPIADVNEAFLFYDSEGQPVGTVQDFVWQAWQAGDLKAEVGATALMLELPEGWHNVIAGRMRPVHLVSATVDILALVVTDEGAARESALVSAEGGDVFKRGISVHFGPPSGRYLLETFNSEEDLQDFLGAHGLAHVVHRIRSPRIRFWNMMFWPPSQRVADIIAMQLRLFEEGRIPDPRPFSFQQLEGSDFSAAWEPVAGGYLASLKQARKVKLWRSA